MLILGAGLAGCIAGVLNQDATIYEAGGGDSKHQAVLRFRSPDVGEAVGIPFKEVKVYKDIFYNGSFCAPDMRLMNWYSAKVTKGGYFDRSIADIETDYRWIAPEGFHNMLRSMCAGRIFFNQNITNRSQMDDTKIISTIPIHSLAGIFGKELDKPPVVNSIYVTKLVVPDADLQQTIYFPDPDVDVYRATMTGNIMRIESMEEITSEDERYVHDAFGIEYDILGKFFFKSHQQPFGKLRPIDEQKRRDFIRMMSRDYGVYSLGRFATWRNILLDDVLHDIHQIRRMMTQDEYEFSKEPV